MVILYAYLFLLGAVIGSFLNVLIDRLPNEESVTGRSHCDYCKKQLPTGVNIPIISWFMLRGRTRCCGKPLSIQYPIIEFTTGMLFVLVWFITPFYFSTNKEIMPSMFGMYSPLSSLVLLQIVMLAITSTLLVIFVADVKYHIIPDSMQLLFLIFSICFVILTSHLSVQTVIGGVIVMAPILLLFLATLGKGMGFADVKFAFTMGVLLGWFNGLLALYMAFITGATVGVLMMVMKRKKMKSTIAFGPFLIIGTVVMLFWGNYIIAMIHRYLSI